MIFCALLFDAPTPPVLFGDGTTPSADADEVY